MELSVRDVIGEIEVRVVREEVKHDEVVEFLKRRGLEDTPVILNVEGWRVAKNFISSRELLCRYIGIRKEDLARYLAELKYEGAAVDVVEGHPLRRVEGFDLYQRLLWGLLPHTSSRCFPRYRHRRNFGPEP